MSYSGKSEIEIVEGCRKYDREAQKALYSKYYGKMNAVSYRYTSSREDAKDVVHDSFVHIFNKISTYTATGSLEGWIRRIVINRSINFLNKRNKNFVKASEEELSYLNDSVAYNEYKNESENMESIYTSGLTKEEIIEAIDSLKESYKIIFNLIVVDGLSHKDIAELLGIKEELSRIRLKRGRAVLQSILLGVADKKRKIQTDAKSIR